MTLGPQFVTGYVTLGYGSKEFQATQNKRVSELFLRANNEH